MKTHPKPYVDSCRSRKDSQLAAYTTLVAGAKSPGKSALTSAVAAIEPIVFNNLVLTPAALVEPPARRQIENLRHGRLAPPRPLPVEYPAG